MSVRAADPARSRIVLVGTPVYDDPLLPDVPEVARNLAGLAAVFTDTSLGGFPAEHCVTAAPDSTVDQVGDLLEEAAEQAEDLLLFYFAGHGLIGARGELFLGLRGTRFRNPAYSALRFETVRDTFLSLRTKAASRAVIIDSCFSGRAIGSTLAGGGDTLADELEISGTYTLTSAPPNSLALVRDGEPYTAFTGRLLDLLCDGSTQAGDLISLGEIYRHLYTRLRADGLPLPQQRGTGTADLLGLIRNRRSAPVVPAALPEDLRAGLDSRYPQVRIAAVEVLAAWLTDGDSGRVPAARTVLAEIAEQDIPRVARAARDVLLRHPPTSSSVEGTGSDSGSANATGLAHARRLADEAERAALAITDEGAKARALADITAALTRSDPRRAEALADEAERVALAITGEGARAFVLAQIVGVLAGSDPQRAERIALAITDETCRVRALASIAGALIDNDPQNADRLADQAERAALAITDGKAKARALADITATLIRSDPQRVERLIDHAEHATSAITDLGTQATLAADLAAALVDSDPQHAEWLADQAERAALAIPDAQWKATILAFVALALVRNNPQHAKRLVDQAEYQALANTNENTKELELSHIVHALAGSDPQRAEYIALSITDGVVRELALADIAEAVAGSDLERAERIARAITIEVCRAQALAGIAGALADSDPQRAEDIASAITDERSKAKALIAILKTQDLNSIARGEYQHIAGRTG